MIIHVGTWVPLQNFLKIKSSTVGTTRILPTFSYQYQGAKFVRSLQRPFFKTHSGEIELSSTSVFNGVSNIFFSSKHI